MRNGYEIFAGKPEDRDPFGDPGIHVRILRKILGKQCLRIWSAFIWFRPEFSNRLQLL
jgi:hypothetical protein